MHLSHCTIVSPSSGSLQVQNIGNLLVWLLHHPLARTLRKRSDSPIVEALHQMPSHFTLVKDFGGQILLCTYGSCKCNGKKSTVIGTTLPLYVTVTDSDGIAPVLQKISYHFVFTGQDMFMARDFLAHTFTVFLIIRACTSWGGLEPRLHHTLVFNYYDTLTCTVRHACR